MLAFEGNVLSRCDRYQRFEKARISHTEHGQRPGQPSTSRTDRYNRSCSRKNKKRSTIDCQRSSYRYWHIDARRSILADNLIMYAVKVRTRQCHGFCIVTMSQLVRHYPYANFRYLKMYQWYHTPTIFTRFGSLLFVSKTKDYPKKAEDVNYSTAELEAINSNRVLTGLR